jgi:hypothetical protein
LGVFGLFAASYLILCILYITYLLYVFCYVELLCIEGIFSKVPGRNWRFVTTVNFDVASLYCIFYMQYVEVLFGGG